MHLDDADADLLSPYRKIPDPELVARGGLFVAEGRLVVTRLLERGRLRVRSVLVTEAAYRSIQSTLEVHLDTPVYVVPQQVMNAVVGFNIHRGCLAIGERPPVGDWRALARGARQLLVIERVGDADNVGSIFRNAAAFGADAVLLGPGCADPLYRKAIRTSMGAALSLPFAPIAPWPAALSDLTAMGHVTLALTPAADTPALRAVVNRLGDRPVALLLGHEGSGLTPEALGACHRHARIPMSPGTDSLNVATAAAVALYELARR
jgi:tRNA G18 (ribose-2'-O)-methylase SpoU